jgi:DNA excision repair protein ERCC-2
VTDVERQNQISRAEGKAVYTVSVRDLVEFVCRTGDLGSERDFVGPARALAGIRAHQRVQQSRPDGYQAEVAIGHVIEGVDFVLRLQGRIDGVQPGSDPPLIEEIKTVQGVWDGQIDPLHWAQVRAYGALYAMQHDLDQVVLQLTYVLLEGGEWIEHREVCTRLALAESFRATTGLYLEWLGQRHRWCRERDRSLHAAAFPFSPFRPGQRELAVAVYRTLRRGGNLFLEAPTGIGKTMAVLFPTLKALADGRIGRFYYLTARTVGRTVAEQALGEVRLQGLKLRTLTLTAREKLCLQNGRVCDPRSCPVALGYYDRRHAALRTLLDLDGITREPLEAVSRQHQVCPHELALDASLWVDGVIGDYNYAFDPRAWLRRHFADPAQAYALLVDEAHNLVDRAREMFSASLETSELRAVSRAVRETIPRCARSLQRLATAIRQAAGPAASPAGRLEDGETYAIPDLFDNASAQGTREPAKVARSATASTGAAHPGSVSVRELPAPWIPLIEEALQHAEAWLTQNQAADYREQLLDLYFKLFAFRQTAARYDERYATIIERGPSPRARLFCLDPSLQLQDRLKQAQAVICFSATLAPGEYYRALLGGKASDTARTLPSPFAPRHLAVLVEDGLRTDWQSRASSLGEVARAVEALVLAQHGNYLVYLPSYAYLTQVHAEFCRRCPQVVTLTQAPGMAETARDGFLDAFRSNRAETLVGFAVLGGVFGEGIDLVGDRLIGVVVVGVGLPQLCLERDLMRAHFQATTGQGFDFAYLFPGMNRVLQAAGRVIRSETDRGVVLLVDTRFGHHRYRRLFPAWWQTVRVRSPEDIRRVTQSFWRGDLG